jgi:hypothetical protein
MKSFILYPTLGLKTNVPYTDPSLFRWIDENSAQCYCVDGRYIDLARTRNACSKSEGSTQWSNSATASTTYCLGIFELYDGTNRVMWMVYDGNVYRYDSSRDPGEIADAGPTTFASDISDLYSFIRYGNYMVFADFAEHTPYCSDFNDSNLIKLISSGTEYKFRYLESFARRIVGAYSDQTNGDLEIRWSGSNPTPNTDCVFAAANQLYVPNDDPITGIKKMGQNSCFVYCEDSINRLDYYANYSSPFGFTTIVDGQGCTGHHSIVNENNVHYFYNKNYGFCRYDGGTQIIPISQDVENWVRDIRFQYADQIVGALNASRTSVVWACPLEGSATNNAILTYDYARDTWTRRDKAAHYIAPVINATNVTWTKLTTELGYTTWSSLGNQRWADLVSEKTEIAFSATDGHLYTLTTESDNDTDYDGYRVEPALSLAGPNVHSTLHEIWFHFTSKADFNTYVQYRCADTEGELREAAWTTASDEVSVNGPVNAVCRLDGITKRSARLHQIKWGTDGENEQFIVPQIEFRYVPEGRY